MKTTELLLGENATLREHAYSSQYSLISWKPIIAGLFVTAFTYISLSALGAAIAGNSAADVIQEGRNGSTLVMGTVIWIGLSALLSLSAGSYFAARTSTFVTGRIGAAQGLVIASLFFSFMIYGFGKTVGTIGSGLGNMLGAASMGITNIASTPAIQNIVERAYGATNLKSEPAVAVQGLAGRLLQGNMESARNYLAYQTGLPAAAVDSRLATLEVEFKSTMKTVGINAAEAVSNAGWSLFLTLFLGMASAVVGGAFGSLANYKKPLTDEHSIGHLVTQPQV